MRRRRRAGLVLVGLVLMMASGLAGWCLRGMTEEAASR
jgi:hypothetical protein